MLGAFLIAAIVLNEIADLVPFLIATVAIPPLTAYVGRTKGQRAVLPILASGVLAVLTAWLSGGIDGASETIVAGFAMYVSQLAAYVGGWKPLAGINAAAEARRT